MNPNAAYITDVAAALVLAIVGTVAHGGRAMGLYIAGLVLLILTWGVPTLVTLAPRYRLWRRRKASKLASKKRTAAPKP